MKLLSLVLFGVFGLLLCSAHCHAQEDPAEKQESKDVLDFRYLPLPDNASATFIRPQLLAKHSRLRRFIDLNPKFRFFISDDGFFKKQTGLPFSELEQLSVLSWTEMVEIERDNKKLPYRLMRQVVLVHTKNDCKEKLKAFAKEIKNVDGVEMLVFIDEFRNSAMSNIYRCAVQISPNTIALIDGEHVLSSVSSLIKSKGKNQSLLKKLKKYSGCMALSYSIGVSRYQRPFYPWVRVIPDDVINSLKPHHTKIKECFFGVFPEPQVRCAVELVQSSPADATVIKSRLDSMKKKYFKVAEFYGNSTDRIARSIGKSALKSLKTITVKQKEKRVFIEGRFALTDRVVKRLAQYYEAEVLDGIAHEKLRTTARAFHMFVDENGRFPASVYRHKNGQEHSWRIMILPYIGRQDLFDRYRLEEPWDSPHNKEVTKEMPDIFRHPTDTDKNSVSPGFSIVTGDGLAFGDPANSTSNFGSSFKDFTDGTSNTIIGVEVKNGAHWADPKVLSIDEVIGGNFRSGYDKDKIRVMMADGSSTDVSAKASPEVLKRMFTMGGGELFERGEIRFRPKSILEVPK